VNSGEPFSFQYSVALGEVSRFFRTILQWPRGWHSRSWRGHEGVGSQYWQVSEQSCRY